jgi:hypothetical protein
VAFAPLTRGRSNKGKGPADMTVYPPVFGVLSDCGECQLELDGGELAEGSLASPAVVGVLDPHEDRVGEQVEGLHGGVGPGRRDPAHRPGEVVRLEHRHEGLLCATPETRWRPPPALASGMERMGHSSSRAALIDRHATRERAEAIATGMGQVFASARRRGTTGSRSGTTQGHSVLMDIDQSPAAACDLGFGLERAKGIEPS